MANPKDPLVPFLAHKDTKTIGNLEFPLYLVVVKRKISSHRHPLNTKARRHTCKHLTTLRIAIASWKCMKVNMERLMCRRIAHFLNPGDV